MFVSFLRHCIQQAARNIIVTLNIEEQISAITLPEVTMHYNITTTHHLLSIKLQIINKYTTIPHLHWWHLRVYTFNYAKKKRHLVPLILPMELMEWFHEVSIFE